MIRPHLLVPLLLVSCGQPAEDETVDGYTLLSPRRQLIRLSVDLRGVHPSEAELQAIEADPALYDDFVDRFLDDPRFLDRIEEVWNQRLLTGTGSTYGYAHPQASGAEVASAIGGESLQLVRRIVDQDLPWTEIVLADYTVATPLLASLFGLERQPGEGWQPAVYSDGREHAGILTMSSTWLRYPSMGGNANRHRANAVSKMLLCDDYLSRPIVLNRAAVDQLTVDPETAISTNVACQSCHSTLDPLSAHFFGFFYPEDDDGDAVTYRPENEKAWMEYADQPPGYYGVPTASIRELGERIAEDSRFVDCAVRTAYEGLTQHALHPDDWTSFQAHRSAFTGEGLRIKPLVRSIVSSPAYRASAADDPAVAERLAGVKMVSPRQLQTIVEGVTGYKWTFAGTDALTDNSRGLPVLLGGIDGSTVTTPSWEPSVGAVFVQERLAWSAAWDVAAHDLAAGRTAEARMLRFVTREHTPEADAALFDAQIRDLYLQVTGLPLAETAAEPAQLATLWRQIHSVEGTPEAAWAGVLTAILRDPLVLTY